MGFLEPAKLTIDHSFVNRKVLIQAFKDIGCCDWSQHSIGHFCRILHENGSPRPIISAYAIKDSENIDNNGWIVGGN